MLEFPAGSEFSGVALSLFGQQRLRSKLVDWKSLGFVRRVTTARDAVTRGTRAGADRAGSPPCRRWYMRCLTTSGSGHEEVVAVSQGVVGSGGHAGRGG